jgi:membrane protein
VLRRTVAEFRADNVTDWAAALTYYGVLSIFPALIALISVVGLVGSSATTSLLNNLQSFTPGPAKDILTNAVSGLSKNQRAGGVMFVVGLALALWSASGYVAAFMRAANSIWDAPEGRPIWKTLPVRVGVTIITVVVLAAGAIAVVVTGPVARRVGDLIGAGSSAVTIWDIAKWPALVVLFGLLLSILYYAAPNVRHPGFRWVTPGGVVAIILWIAASALFALYVAGYTLGRFWIEALRTDHANHILGLRLNMWTAIVLFVLAVIWFVRHGGLHAERESTPYTRDRQPHERDEERADVGSDE